MKTLNLFAILLTVLFIGLKVANIITWGWLLVLLPLFALISYRVVMTIVAIIVVAIMLNKGSQK